MNKTAALAHIVENDFVTATFPTEEEAKNFQKGLPPGSSRWAEPA